MPGEAGEEGRGWQARGISGMRARSPGERLVCPLAEGACRSGETSWEEPWTEPGLQGPGVDGESEEEELGGSREEHPRICGGGSGLGDAVGRGGRDKRGL